MKLVFSLIFLTFLAGTCLSQELDVRDIQIDDQGIVYFTCKIEPHHSFREEYEILVYSSKDFFREPLPVQLPIVKAGEEQTLRFDGNEVIGDYDGFITFNFGIKATLFPLEIQGLKEKYKRGKPIEITWKDFHNSDRYDILLFEGDSLVYTFAANYTTNSYHGRVPKSISKGNYELCVVPSNNSDLISDEHGIVVKPRNGLLLVGVGGGLLAGGIILAMSNESSSGDLPTPPSFPE